MSHEVVCPLGYASFVNDCPNAPCVDCMARLKDHMIAELGVLERQHKIAIARQDVGAERTLGTLLGGLAGLIQNTDPSSV